MSRLLVGMSVWPSFLSALRRPNQISTQSPRATCAGEDGIFSHVIQCSPTLSAAPFDFSALSPSHKQSTLQITQCSNCSLIPPLSHPAGDSWNCPWGCRGLLASLVAGEQPLPALQPLGQQWVTSPCFWFPPALLQRARLQRDSRGMSLPCSPRWLHSHSDSPVTIQGSLQPLCDGFALCFQLMLKNPCTYPLSGGFCCSVTAFGTAVSHTISQSCTLVSPALPK